MEAGVTSTGAYEMQILMSTCQMVLVGVTPYKHQRRLRDAVHQRTVGAKMDTQNTQGQDFAALV